MSCECVGNSIPKKNCIMARKIDPPISFQAILDANPSVFHHSRTASSIKQKFRKLVKDKEPQASALGHKSARKEKVAYPKGSAPKQVVVSKAERALNTGAKWFAAETQRLMLELRDIAAPSKADIEGILARNASIFHPPRTVGSLRKKRLSLRKSAQFKPKLDPTKVLPIELSRCASILPFAISFCCGCA